MKRSRASRRSGCEFEYINQSRLHKLGAEEFGPDTQIPPKAWPALATSILARLATEHHMVYCASGGELQARHFPGLLRAHVVAPENVRIGNLMLDHRLERAAARQLMLDLEAADRADRKAKFGKTKATADLFDLVLNAEALNSEQMAELIATAATSMGLAERGFLSTAAEAQLQFQMRYRLARYGLTPLRKRGAAQEDLRAPERRDVRQPAGFLPHRVGVRTAQLSHPYRTPTAKCWKPSRPIFTCRSSSFMSS